MDLSTLPLPMLLIIALGILAVIAIVLVGLCFMAAAHIGNDDTPDELLDDIGDEPPGLLLDVADPAPSTRRGAISRTMSYVNDFMAEYEPKHRVN